jgi:voltage-gated potassium channel
MSPAPLSVEPAPAPGAPRSLRERVFCLLDAQHSDTAAQRLTNAAFVALITLNVAAVILESVESLATTYREQFLAFERVSVAVFTVEYVLRLWSCTADGRYRHPLSGRLRFAVSPAAVIDLLSILPSLIPGGVVDLRFARALRLLRFARAFKIVRYSQSLQLLARVLRNKRQELMVTGFAGMILLVCAACGIYFAEHDAQPKAFPSIPAAMWWGVITLTTVGYGDVYPITIAGRLIASVVAMSGIGLFALPAGILAGGFAEEIAAKRGARVCPHCRNEIA